MKLSDFYNEITKHSADYAPGIPMKQTYMDTRPGRNPFSSLNGGKVPFSIQEHKAERAGKHYDLRLVKDDKAYSWALRYLPKKSGEKRLAVAQPIHTKDYALGFEGKIELGYGKGDVKIFDKGMAKVKVSDTGNLKLEILKNKNSDGLSGNFVIIKPNDKNVKSGRNNNWLIIKK